MSKIRITYLSKRLVEIDDKLDYLYKSKPKSILEVSCGVKNTQEFDELYGNKWLPIYLKSRSLGLKGIGKSEFKKSEMKSDKYCKLMGKLRDKHCRKIKRLEKKQNNLMEKING